MKTAFASPSAPVPFLIASKQEVQTEKAPNKCLLKSDLWNHRFAIIDNNVVQDPINWDEAWFGNYE